MAERRPIGWPKQNCLSTLGGLPIYTTLASKYMQLWSPNIYNLTRLISGLNISKPTLPPYLYTALAVCNAMYRVTKQILKFILV